MFISGDYIDSTKIIILIKTPFPVTLKEILQMLKPRALTSILAQANTDGVLSTFLFKQDGTLLGYSSVDQGRMVYYGELKAKHSSWSFQIVQTPE